MPGASASKFEAMGPVRVDIAPVLMVVLVMPGDPVAAAHAALVAASGRTAAVALVAGAIATAPAVTTAHAPAQATRRAKAPFRLVCIASPSFQLLIISPVPTIPTFVWSRVVTVVVELHGDRSRPPSASVTPRTTSGGRSPGGLGPRRAVP